MTGRLVAVLIASAALGADWAQFRGPNAGVAEGEYPTRWSKTENVRWKAELPGRGVSCPVVAGDRVYVTCASGPRETRLHLVCLDAGSGKQLWHRQLFATGNTFCHPTSSMAAPTPAADATGVYALFATGDLAAFDPDGNLLWYRSLTGDYPTITNSVGMASSPLLWNGLLVVPMDNVGESFIAALDIKDGTNRWRTPRPRNANWTTPVVWKRPGGSEELIFQGPGGLTGYDPTSGKELWALKDASGSIPSPVVDGDKLYVSEGGSPGGTQALQATAARPAPEVLWKSAKLRNGMNSSVAHAGKVYSVNSVGVLVCGEPATGNVVWQERVGTACAATPIIANNKAYCFSEKGECAVVELGDKPKKIASNTLGEGVYATPAFSGGAIFVRTDKHVYCVAGAK